MRPRLTPVRAWSSVYTGKPGIFRAPPITVIPSGLTCFSVLSLGDALKGMEGWWWRMLSLFSFLNEDRGFIVCRGLSWNSLCRQAWPWTHRALPVCAPILLGLKVYSPCSVHVYCVLSHLALQRSCQLSRLLQVSAPWSMEVRLVLIWIWTMWFLHTWGDVIHGVLIRK